MHSFRRLRILALAFVVWVLQAALPVLAYARMAADNALAQEICTSGGTKRVAPGPDGALHEVAADATHGDHCPLCSGAGATPLPTLIQLHESARNPGAIRVTRTCFQGGTAINKPPATGPPPRS